MLQLDQLLEVPAKKKIFTMAMLGSVGVTVAGAAVISGMYHAIKK